MFPQVCTARQAVELFGKRGLDRSLKMSQNGRRDGGLVFTNGCFDLLHPGHHHLLNEARKLGGALCVGLNSDASIRALKGDDRPIVPSHLRAITLCDLRCVDAVVMFDDPTPIELIKLLEPDVLVKGDDYRGQVIVGQEEVIGWGGAVHFVEQLRGWSTTAILSKTTRGVA